jgi:D-methionine transport system substrate-binding protein
MRVMQLKHTLLGILTLALAVSMGAGCSKSKKLRVGVISGFEEEVAAVAIKLAKERYGTDAELVVFSDYVNPNAALADGSLDVNAFQHQPFLTQQVKDRGYKIVPVGKTFVYPIAAYSKRIKSVSELKDGAEVAVPNDPTNLGRALLLLQKQGLITLKPGSGAQASVLDVAQNPKKLRIVELEAPQLPRALPDVDLAVINTNYASQIDLSPTKDGLFREGSDSPYVNLIVARDDNKNSEAVRNFVKAYQSDEVYEKAKTLFQGGVIKGW